MRVRFIERGCALMLFVVASGCSLIVTIQSIAVAAESTAPRRTAAAEAVREALQREVYGLANDRDQLLFEALEHDPKLDAAHWHLGSIKNIQGRWVDHEQHQITGLAAKRLAEYRQLRDEQPDTVDGHLAIAHWCSSKNLVDQERAHLARVVDLSPDHSEARSRLGFVRVQGIWLSRDEILREQSRQRQAVQSLVHYRPHFQEILAGLQHRSEQRRRKAVERLMEASEVAAIPAMEEVIASAGETEELAVVNALATIADPAASTALARHAVFSPSLAVREAAVAKLRVRKLDSYVPGLLGSLYSPVISRVTTLPLPGGRIGYRHEFAREGKDEQQLLVLDTEYRREARAGGSRRQSAERAIADVGDDAIRREQAVAAQNLATQQMNDRILWVLKQATNESLANDPSAWWQWWNEKNEVFIDGAKSIAVVQQTRTVSVVDEVPTGSTSGVTPPPTTLDCLAAGTLVWTSEGQRAIETIRLGDLVLSQDAETGELAYKPVLKTTVRPRGPLVRLQIDGEQIETSGGHLFWAAGDGWLKSRELKPGMVLHSVDGPARVQTVATGATAETYNLIVADFNTYFVGANKVLSHDNTIRTPTRAIVPGLRLD